MNKIKLLLCFALMLCSELSFGNELAAGTCKKYQYKGIEYTFRYCPPNSRFPKGFWLGETEVTLQMYKQFMEENPDYQSPTIIGGLIIPESKRDNSPKEYSWRCVGFEQSDLHPVTLISAQDAIAFCKWLSKKLNVSIRLPRYREWIYAASEGDDDIDSFVITEKNFFKYGNFADKDYFEVFYKNRDVEYITVVEYSDGYVYTAPVKSYLPNKWGLYDMFGNVSEITLPPGIMRDDVWLYGGSWFEKPRVLLVGPSHKPETTRFYTRPINRADNHHGFRLLLENN